VVMAGPGISEVNDLKRGHALTSVLLAGLFSSRVIA